MYTPEGKTSLACRTNTIQEIAGVKNPFWEAARNSHLLLTAVTLAQNLQKTVVIYGEAIGPKALGIKNYYQRDDYAAYVFDIRVDWQWLNPCEFLEICEQNGLTTVPVLARGLTLREWLNGESIAEAAEGGSLIPLGPKAKFPRPREGIVVRPMTETRLDGFGRLILKQHSLSYLAKHGG